MFGLIVLSIFIVYCLLCYGFVRVIASLPPKSQCGRRRRYGLVAFLIFNAPLGYQFVPAFVVGSYGCFTDAGFELYKTPEQWKEENPEVAKILKAYSKVRSEQLKREHPEGHFDFATIYHLNDRFDWKVDYRYVVKNLVKKEETVVDIKTTEIMARKIDYLTEFYHLSLGNRVLGSGCFKKFDRERWLVDGDNMRTYIEKIMDIGDKK